MNRKIMSGLSYGFYFIIICLIFVVVYLLFFKSDKPKKDNKVDDDNQTKEVVSENIKLNKKDVSMDIGGSFDLKVTLVPSNGDEVINYESNDENIATVDNNGKIVGVSAGETTILVTVEGTNLKTECKVVVSNNIITVQELFVQNSVVNIKVDETYQLNVTAIPSNAVDKSLTYSIDAGNDYLTVDENGLVTALKVGRGKVRITSNANQDVSIIVDFIIK